MMMMATLQVINQTLFALLLDKLCLLNTVLWQHEYALMHFWGHVQDRISFFIHK